MEGSSAPGEELVVSDTRASVSQQPNAIAKSQLWPRIALAGLLCVQDEEITILLAFIWQNSARKM